MPKPPGASIFYNLREIYELLVDNPAVQETDGEGRPVYTDANTPVYVPGTGEPLKLEVHVEERGSRSQAEDMGIDLIRQELRIRIVNPPALPEILRDRGDITGTLNLAGRDGLYPDAPGTIRLIPTAQRKLPKINKKGGVWIKGLWEAVR